MQFYALPQTNTTATGRTIRPAGNWLMITPKSTLPWQCNMKIYNTYAWDRWPECMYVCDSCLQVILCLICFLCAAPDYPILNGTSCYSLTHDRREGIVNATIQLSLHSGWKSLAPVASIRGELSLQEPHTLFPAILISVKTYLKTHTIEASCNFSIELTLTRQFKIFNMHY